LSPVAEGRYLPKRAKTDKGAPSYPAGHESGSIRTKRAEIRRNQLAAHRRRRRAGGYHVAHYLRHGRPFRVQPRLDPLSDSGFDRRRALGSDTGARRLVSRSRRLGVLFLRTDLQLLGHRPARIRQPGIVYLRGGRDRPACNQTQAAG
jgi:hypothetical protein